MGLKNCSEQSGKFQQWRSKDGFEVDKRVKFLRKRTFCWVWIKIGSKQNKGIINFKPKNSVTQDLKFLGKINKTNTFLQEYNSGLKQTGSTRLKYSPLLQRMTNVTSSHATTSYYATCKACHSRSLSPAAKSLEIVSRQGNIRAKNQGNESLGITCEINITLEQASEPNRRWRLALGWPVLTNVQKLFSMQASH